MTDTSPTDDEDAELNAFLARVVGGRIANAEALVCKAPRLRRDGFFAALVCCPDMVMPSEYLPMIQGGATEEGDLVFEDMAEGRRFMALLFRHYNHVNDQLQNREAYMPLVLEDENGDWHDNDWANGFLLGISLRPEIWSEIIDSEERGGSVVPIFMLAYEHHPDPAMRPYSEPIDEKKREELLVSAAAGVMHMHRYFLDRHADYLPAGGPFVRQSPRVGRNAPCPCGSGRKFKQCCGRSRTLH